MGVNFKQTAETLKDFNVCLIFCKKTGVKIGELPLDPDSINNIDYEKLDIKLLNLKRNEEYVGSFLDGKVIDFYKKPIIREVDVIKETEDMFFHQYGVTRLLQIMLKMIEKNCDQQTDEFKDCILIYNSLFKKCNRKIEVARSNKDGFEFIPKEIDYDDNVKKFNLAYTVQLENKK